MPGFQKLAHAGGGIFLIFTDWNFADDKGNAWVETWIKAIHAGGGGGAESAP